MKYKDPVSVSLKHILLSKASWLCILACCLLTFALPIHAKDQAAAAPAPAFAVLQDNGELVFFESTSSYTDYSRGDFKDKTGHTYHGMILHVYNGFNAGTLERQAEIPIKSIRVADGQTVSGMTSMYAWFRELKELQSFSGKGFDTSAVTDMGSLFYGCAALNSLDVSAFDTSAVRDMNSMFEQCWELETLDLSSFDTSSVRDMSHMFQLDDALKELRISSFRTSKVRDMEMMFGGCSSLTALDVSAFDTSSVTNMEAMFFDCSALSRLDVHSFDTSNVTTMGWMFASCSSLTALDLGSFETSKVTDMDHMFYGCSELTGLDLGSFDTANVTNMNYLFTYCAELTSLDLSSFDTASVEYMSYMFDSCTSLASLDIHSFDTSAVETMTGMFGDAANCPELRSVRLGSGFTVWHSDAALPDFGIWTNGDVERRAEVLCQEYPANAASWAGTWHVLDDLMLPFVDVSSDKYYYLPVRWAYYHDPQITTGTDDTHFSPGQTCTRSQVVTFLWRAYGCPEPKTAKNPFKDVKSTAFYYKAVLWALENKITTGVDATHFSPGTPCTRAQVVTFMYRASGEPEIIDAINPFEDVRSSAYYYKAVQWAYENRITSGTTAYTFSPNDSCTRGQIVTFLYRNR